MNKVTFKNNGQKEYLASTGERINYYTSAEFGMGAGTYGWYITEADDTFTGNRYETLKDAKNSIIRRRNTEQYAEIVIAKAEKTVAAYLASKVSA